MRNFLWTIIPIALTAGALFWIYEYERRPLPQLPSSQAPQAAPATAPPTTPPLATHYPIPDAPPNTDDPDLAGSIPSLAESDSAMRAALVSVLGLPSFTNLFWPKEVVQHLVAVVDNLPRGHVSQSVMPVKKTPGRFLVKNNPNGNGSTIDPSNYARYAPYVDVLESVDSAKLVALYIHFYPLFQQAYKDLGYPSGYFNDRLVAAIDDALAAPEPSQPPALLEPHLMYQYADPDIEALSAGQKTMIRMGPKNEARVKAKLKAIRSDLTSQGNPAKH